MRNLVGRHPLVTRRPRRRGVTLTEVLVSLGIMSLGVITVATLFPLSVLRTVQATQLTNATNLRYNAEALLRAIPSMANDPDLNGSNNASEAYVVDPMGYYRYYVDGQPADDLLKDDFGGGPVKRYRGFAVTTNAPLTPGDYNDDEVVDETDAQLAAALVSSPDSWTEVLTDTPSLDTMNSEATFTEDVSAVNAGDRLVFFEANGRASETRPITAVDAGMGVVGWGGALPAGFTVGEVRIEAQYLRYSWLATVRNSAGVATVNVAVFFNRGLGHDEEHAYVGVDAGNGTSLVFTNGSALATIKYDSAMEPEPSIDEGSFVLDATNLHWYRMSKVESRSTSGTEETIVISLTEQARDDSNAAIFFPQLVDVFPIGSIEP